MDTFDWLPTGKLNDVDLTYPDDDITKGFSPIVGMLGQRFKYGNARALSFSKTSVATLKGGIFTPVRLSPSMTAAIASAVRGRPVFWADTTKKVVTCDVTAMTSLFAGFLLNTVTALGNITIIQCYGEVGALFKNPLTKATPVVGNVAHIDIASGIATLDVLADATAPTWGTMAAAENLGARVAAAVTAGAVSNVWIRPLQLMNEGIM